MRVLIADDHRLVRELLRTHLESQPDIQVVAEAEDGHAALELACLHRPDVAILDVTMPGMNGLEALAWMQRDVPEVNVLILSMHLNEEYVVRALRGGARGYLLKDSDPADLIRAVRAAARGERCLIPPLTEEVVQAYLERLGDAEDPLAVLTPRERQVLQLIAEGYSTLAAANLLQISPKTIETHRANIMEKLDLHDVASLTRFAVQAGLVV